MVGQGGLLAIACAKISGLDRPAFIKDSELRFVAVNAAFEAYVERGAAALLGQGLESVGDRIANAALIEAERRALESAEEQTALMADDGGHHPCRVQIERFTTEDERRYVFGVFRDRPVRGRRRSAAARRPDVRSVWPMPAAVTGPDQPRSIDAPAPAPRLERARPAHAPAEATAEVQRRNSARVPAMAAMAVEVVEDRLSSPPLRSDPIRATGDEPPSTPGEQDFLRLLDCLDLGVLLVGRDGRLRYFNDLMRRTFAGFNLPLAAGEPFEAIVDGLAALGMLAETPQARHQINQRLAAVASDGIETCLIHLRDGTVISASSRRLQDGGFAVFYSDITMVDTHQRDNALYRAALEHVAEPVFLRDGDRRLVYANAAYEQMLGGERGQFYGLRDDEMFPENAELVRQENLQVLAGVDTLDSEQLITMPTGEKVSLLVSVRRIEDTEGRPYIVGMLADVSQLKRREAELVETRQRAEKLYRDIDAIIQSMPVGVIILSETLRVSFSNERARQLIFWPEDRPLEGTVFDDYLRHAHAMGWQPDGDPEEIAARIEGERARLERVETSAQMEFALAGDRHVLVIANRLDDGSFLLTYSEITEAKRREVDLAALAARAEAADRAKSRFLANMSHEIRTPMNGVLGMAELLATSVLDARQTAFVDVIVKSGRLLMTIINDILDFSRIDERRLSLRAQAFDPVLAAEDVVALMAGRAAEKGLELVLEGTVEIEHLLLGDAGRFRQILTNLVGDAITATDQGHVRLALAAEDVGDDRLTLTVVVEDTGPGFTADQRQQAFSRFSQMGEAALSHRGGAGLGLSIAAGLVELFGGTIDLDSAPGEGARFTIRLPLPIAGWRPVDETSPHLAGARVLALVERPLQAGVLAEQLHRWSLDGAVLAEADLVEAVLREAVESGQPVELLLVDLSPVDLPLQRSRGLALIRRLRADPAFRDLAIIALLAEGLDSERLPLDSLALQAQLIRPVGDSLLHRSLLEVLRVVRRPRWPAAASGGPPSLAGDALPQGDPFPEVVPSSTPCLAPDRLPAPTGSPIGTATGPRPERSVDGSLDILLFADNALEQGFLRGVIEQAGLTVALAPPESGQVLQYWRLHRPRLVLLDLGCDDEELAALVRGLRDAERADSAWPAPSSSTWPTIRPAMRIVVLRADPPGAAAAAGQDRAHRSTAGVDAVIRKPISPKRLLDGLRPFLPSVAMADVSETEVSEGDVVTPVPV